MSRKFRWFLLASCAFVVLMGGREALNMLADGPQVQSSSPELNSPSQLATVRKRTEPTLPARRLPKDGEVARGEAK